MTTDWSEVIHQLRTVRLFDYFKNRSMPEFVEPLITELVDSFDRSTEAERQSLCAIPKEVSGILGWYARKLAGRAVRERQVMDLRKGLLALAISMGGADYRDVIAPLALLYNSALRLNEDPRTLFESASNKSSQTARDFFAAFMDRPPELRSIQIFGFGEGTGPHGFDYIPLLPEFGGPVPF